MPASKLQVGGIDGAWHGFVMLNCPLFELQLTVMVPEAVYPGAHVKAHCATVFAADAALQLPVL
jgi:hypothetical protein